MHEYDSEQEFEAVDRLHKKDMNASKAGDFQTLRSLITDDAVVMPPGGKVLRGKQELDASFDHMKDMMGQIELLDYALEFEEVRVFDDYAFEWGWIKGSSRARGSDEVVRAVYKVLRILQRQPDGEWKVYRTIWNEHPSGEKDAPGLV